MDEPFASLDAIVRARVVKDVVALVERRKYQRSSGHPRSRRGDQPLRRGLPAVAGTACAYHAALSGADSAAARSGPFAHASRLRAALRETVGGPLPRSGSPGGGGMMLLDPRYAWMRQLAAFTVLLAIWEAGRPRRHAQSNVCAEPEQDRSGARRAVLRRPHLAASRRNLHCRARRSRARHCRWHSARRRRGARSGSSRSCSSR